MNNTLALGGANHPKFEIFDPKKRGGCYCCRQLVASTPLLITISAVAAALIYVGCAYFPSMYTGSVACLTVGSCAAAAFLLKVLHVVHRSFFSTPSTIQLRNLLVQEIANRPSTGKKPEADLDSMLGWEEDLDYYRERSAEMAQGSDPLSRFAHQFFQSKVNEVSVLIAASARLYKLRSESLQQEESAWWASLPHTDLYVILGVDPTISLKELTQRFSDQQNSEQIRIAYTLLRRIWKDLQEAKED